jgi:hypothetical protein
VDIDFICLANSRKNGARCVAGLRVDTHQWIRPIGTYFSDGSLSAHSIVLPDGSQPALLDIVRFSAGDTKPTYYQPENVVAELTKWTLIQRPGPPEHLGGSISFGPTIFGNSRDRIDAEALRASPAVESLKLVQPDSNHVQWYVTTNYGGRFQLRAEFDLSNEIHDLVVTDPVWEDKFRNLKRGYHSTQEVADLTGKSMVLTISMGGPWQGFCYKYVVGVMII